jgi:alkaline phosphatase
VLLGGGWNQFLTVDDGGQRRDGRDLAAEFAAAGFDLLRTADDVRARLAGPPPAALLGLFHPSHMAVAFDKIGAGRYSDELALPANEGLRRQPMLDDMTRLALASLEAHSPDGFYLIVEGASIDKRAHDVDPERTIWDIIEFDRAIQAAIDFAARTNSDADPSNDTLIVVTADHETGGMAVIAVGNERYAPHVVGAATRDYVSPYRFNPETGLNQFPNYEIGPDGYPVDPDPTRKVVMGWASTPDRYENYVSNRMMLAAAVRSTGEPVVSMANPARNGPGEDSDNRTADGRAIPGMLVPGTVEHGSFGCRADDGCPDGTAAFPHTIAHHTATDVPLSAGGAGAWQFTGTYDNTNVFFKLLRAAMGSYGEPETR